MERTWTHLQLLTNALEESALVPIPWPVHVLALRCEGQLDAFLGFCLQSDWRATGARKWSQRKEQALGASSDPLAAADQRV